MRKYVLSLPLLFVALCVSAQIEVIKIADKEAKEYKLGFGAFLRFSLPVSEADYLSVEGGAKFIPQKEYSDEGMAVIPLKVGYRYTVNRSGTGLYVEPQLGYNAYGVKSVYNGYNYDDVKFNGVIGSFGAGYLFQPGNKIQFDLGIYYESIFYKGGPTQYIGLRLSHNFLFGQRSEW